MSKPVAANLLRDFPFSSSKGSPSFALSIAALLDVSLPFLHWLMRRGFSHLHLPAPHPLGDQEQKASPPTAHRRRELVFLVLVAVQNLLAALISWAAMAWCSEATGAIGLAGGCSAVRCQEG